MAIIMHTTTTISTSENEISTKEAVSGLSFRFIKSGVDSFDVASKSSTKSLYKVHFNRNFFSLQPDVILSTAETRVASASISAPNVHMSFPSREVEIKYKETFTSRATNQTFRWKAMRLNAVTNAAAFELYDTYSNQIVCKVIVQSDLTPRSIEIFHSDLSQAQVEEFLLSAMAEVAIYRRSVKARF